MIYSMYLDDERTPKGHFDVIVRSYDEAVDYVKKHGAPSYVSFDNDLGLASLEGYDFAKWLVEQDLLKDGDFLPHDFCFSVHSANPVARQNIFTYLDNYMNCKATGLKLFDNIP